MDTMKRRRFPNTYVILSILIMLCALATLVVPPGQYVTAADGSVSFESVPRAPQTWQVFSALFDGFVDKADIIIFILMVGGAFNILNISRAIEVGVMAFLRRVLRLNKYRLFKRLGVENIIITL